MCIFLTMKIELHDLKGGFFLGNTKIPCPIVDIIVCSSLSRGGGLSNFPVHIDILIGGIIIQVFLDSCSVYISLM